MAAAASCAARPPIAAAEDSPDGSRQLPMPAAPLPLPAAAAAAAEAEPQAPSLVGRTLGALEPGAARHRGGRAAAVRRRRRPRPAGRAGRASGRADARLSGGARRRGPGARAGGEHRLGLSRPQRDRAGALLRRCWRRSSGSSASRSTRAIERLRAARRRAGAGSQAERALRRALVTPGMRLLTKFNALPDGMKFLVNMRADLLALIERRSEAQGARRRLPPPARDLVRRRLPDPRSG